MIKTRNRAEWLIVAAPVLALVLLLIGGYVGAYLGLGQRTNLTIGIMGERTARIRGIGRIYSYEWVETVFAPAAWVESKLSGVEVEVAYRNPDAI